MRYTHQVTEVLWCLQIILQGDLNSFAEDAEPTMRFLAMLAGPFYPILQIVSERYVNLVSLVHNAPRSFLLTCLGN